MGPTIKTNYTRKHFSTNSSLTITDWWQSPCLDLTFAQFDEALFCSSEGWLQSFLNSFSGKHLLFWLHTINPICCKFPPNSRPPLPPPVCFLSLSSSLSLPGVIGQSSVSVHSGGIKPPLGVETPAAFCLIPENTDIKTLLLTVTLLAPSRHLRQNWLWIFNVQPCVKDLQRSLQHAWKGKTNLVWTGA